MCDIGQLVDVFEHAEKIRLGDHDRGNIALCLLPHGFSRDGARFAVVFDLDQFDVRPAAESGGASVLIGRQVNERLFVGFRYEFGDAETGQLSFEYRLNEFLRIVTSLAQGGGRSLGARRAEAAGFDLIFVVR